MQFEELGFTMGCHIASPFVYDHTWFLLRARAVQGAVLPGAINTLRYLRTVGGYELVAAYAPPAPSHPQSGCPFVQLGASQPGHPSGEAATQELKGPVLSVRKHGKRLLFADVEVCCAVSSR